jgi:hypothetical protein
LSTRQLFSALYRSIANAIVTRYFGFDDWEEANLTRGKNIFFSAECKDLWQWVVNEPVHQLITIMKKIVFSFLILTGSIVAGCKDQIDTPSDNSATERIVFMPIDESISPKPSGLVISASFDGTTFDTITPIGALYGAATNKIVWSVSGGPQPELRISDNQGGNVSRINYGLASGETFDGGLFSVLSPDGTRFAYFTYSTNDSKFRLYVINTVTSDIELITSQYAKETVPSFSPDSKKIAYYITDGVTMRSGSIEIATLGSSGRSTLVQVADAGYEGAGRISWSKKNVLAYYDSYSTYCVHEDGSNKHLVDNGAASAVWSPDGSALAYAADPAYPTDPTFFDIYVTSDEGLTKTKITATDTVKEGFPQWSSDGKRLVVTSWTGDFDKAVFTLEQIDVATHKVTPVATPGAFGYYVK